MEDWMKLLILLVVITILSWLLLFVCYNVIGEAVSRRFLNTSYVIWIIALSLQVSSILLAIDIAIKYFSFAGVPGIVISSKNCLLESVNYNGLLYFLLANVLTGLVNVSVQTLYTPSVTSFIILSIYTLLLSITSMWLHFRQLKIKFW